MRAWTNGRQHLVFSDAGLRLHEGDRMRVIHTHGVSAPFVRSRVMASADVDVILSWTAHNGLMASSRVDWLGSGRRTMELQPTAVAFLGSNDVIAVTERATSKSDFEQVLVQRSIASLWDGRRDPPEWLPESEVIALPAPTHAAWPDGAGRLWKQPPTLMTNAVGETGALRSAGTHRSIRRERAYAETDSFDVATNAHGTVAVDRITGVIAILRSGRAPVTLQVPSEHPEVPLDVAATRVGVLVSHGGGRGEGALNHFTGEGHHLGGHGTFGSTVPIAIAGDRAFVVDTESLGSVLVMRVFDLEGLTLRETVPLGLETSRGDASIAVSPDGHGVLVVQANEARWLHAGADGWHITPVVAPSEPVPAAAEPPPAPAAPSLPRRVKHAKFGTGTVLSVSGDGDQRKLRIAFDEAGEKSLLARFVQTVES